MIQGAPIQRNLTDRFSKEGRAELPSCRSCSQSGHPCRALPKEGFWVLDTALPPGVKRPLWFPSYYHPYHSPGALCGDITFNPSSILGLPKKVKAVFLLTEVPLTCAGHFNALCPKRLLQSLFLQPYLGKQHTQLGSPARSLSHLLCYTLQQQSHLALSSSLSSGSVPSLHPPASTHSRNWLACTPSLQPQPGEHESNFTINTLRHLASAKQRLEVSQRDPQKSSLLSKPH